jgi:hypothetical protein
MHLSVDGLKNEPPDEVDTARTDVAALAELERLYREVMLDGGSQWRARQEGTSFAAMGGPIVCFYQDDSVDVKAGALCVGSGGDWGPTDVKTSAALVIGLYNNAPSLLRTAKVARRLAAELEALEGRSEIPADQREQLGQVLAEARNAGLLSGP